MALLTVCIWGTTFVSTKLLLVAGMSPDGIFTARFLLAYLGWKIFFRSSREISTSVARSPRSLLLLTAAGVTGGSLYFLTENTALQYADAATVSIIVCLAPLFTALLAMMARREQTTLRRRCWWGMIVSFVGVALVIGGDSGFPDAHAFSLSGLVGGLLALCAAWLWAAYQHLVPMASHAVGVSALTRGVFVYGLLTRCVYEAFRAIGIFIFGGDGTALPFYADITILCRQPMLGLHLLFLGWIASLLCYVVWNKVILRLGAVASAGYIYLNPVVTCLCAAWLLDESLTPLKLVGGAACLLGVYMAVKK
jgi:drug/metabolite transporter (DMT)-like permease